MKSLKKKFLFYLVLICLMHTGQDMGYGAGMADRLNQGQHSSTQIIGDEKALNFMWILGEITLVIITAVLALLIYNRQLRKAVNRKTLELKNFNLHLEDKIEERTSDLRKSREAYKKMYAHAEEERKRAKVALKSERDAILQNLNFIEMISHEYRTPLSGLSSSIDILEKKCSMIEYHDFDDQLKKMKISIQRLVDVFESSLGKERMEKLTPQLCMEKLNLVQIIDSAIELTRTAYIHHRVIFDSELSEHVQVTGDEKLLVTVFTNILDNACKYSEATGQIRIRVNPGEDHVKISISDSGMGIDEDEIPFVFKKYFRSQHTGVKQGAGIGLFLVKKIMALHYGEIQLESQRNVGTQISVLLPMEKNYKRKTKNE